MGRTVSFQDPEGCEEVHEGQRRMDRRGAFPVITESAYIDLCSLQLFLVSIPLPSEHEPTKSPLTCTVTRQRYCVRATVLELGLIASCRKRGCRRSSPCKSGSLRNPRPPCLCSGCHYSHSGLSPAVVSVASTAALREALFAVSLDAMDELLLRSMCRKARALAADSFDLHCVV